MALPAVILKAGSALKKAAKAKAIQKATETTGDEVKAKLKIPMVAFGLIGVGLAFFVIMFISTIAYAQTLFTMDGAVNGTSTGTSSGGTTEVGEAASIEGEEARIAWLYDGKGVPQTEEENAQYLETFDVEYLDANGNVQTKAMTMHKKLKTEVQAIFKDMISIGFKLEWESGGGSIRGWYDSGYSGAFYYSGHCYGHAIDINVDANPMPSQGVGGTYEPGVNPYSVTPEVVDIWKKHGFYWGGDWSSTPDYMHFCYFNH